MQQERFNYLNHKFLNNSISEAELQEYLNLLEQHEDLFYASLDEEQPLLADPEFDSEQAFNKLLQDPQMLASGKQRFRIPYRWLGAAAVLLCCFGLLYTLNQQQHSQSTELIAQAPEKSDKAGNHPEQALGAIKLADGTNLNLEDIQANAIDYHGIQLSKTDNDLIKVTLAQEASKSSQKAHEFSTPKGISYTLMLPDGTTVQMNSGSTLKMNADFNEQNRQVALSGEAFFNVAHDAQKPFMLQTKDYNIKVLGTQFNVKSYPQFSKSQTALVKGSVEVSGQSKKIKLIPGEQVLGNKSGALQVSKANFRESLAWREGYFRFSQASLNDIMNDIISWYNIDEVVYLDQVNEQFTGSIKRTRSLKDVLTAMERIANLKFDIKEGRILVRK